MTYGWGVVGCFRCRFFARPLPPHVRHLPDVVQVTVLLQGLFTLNEMVLSPDLEADLTAYILGRCKDLGAVDKVRVYRKSPAGVATIRFRLPEAATSCIARFASTATISGMFTLPVLAADAELSRVVLEDVLVKCRELGVRLAVEAVPPAAQQCPVRVLASSSAGRVMVACAGVEDAATCVEGMAGLGYAGVHLCTARVDASMWGAPPTFFFLFTVCSCAVQNEFRMSRGCGQRFCGFVQRLLVCKCQSICV
jgi:hypothetical protein